MPCDQGKHWRRTYSKKDQTYWWKCTENNGYLMGDDSTETPALNSQEAISPAAQLDTPEEYENENLESLPKDQLTFDNLGYHFGKHLLITHH